MVSILHGMHDRPIHKLSSKLISVSWSISCTSATFFRKFKARLQWWQYRCQNKFFLFNQSFLLHCSLPIATKHFGGAVCSLFDPAFTGSFPISATKKCLICRKSTFPHFFIQYFSQKIPSCITILFPTPLKSKVG